MKRNDKDINNESKQTENLKPKDSKRKGIRPKDGDEAVVKPEDLVYNKEEAYFQDPQKTKIEREQPVNSIDAKT